MNRMKSVVLVASSFQELQLKVNEFIQKPLFSRGKIKEKRNGEFETVVTFRSSETEVML